MPEYGYSWVMSAVTIGLVSTVPVTMAEARAEAEFRLGLSLALALADVGVDRRVELFKVELLLQVRDSRRGPLQGT